MQLLDFKLGSFLFCQLFYVLFPPLSCHLLDGLVLWFKFFHLLFPPNILLRLYILLLDFPGSSDDKESACNAGDLGSVSGLGRFPWRRAWQPTPVFLPGEPAWTEEPGRLQSMGSQRGRHDWMTNTFTFLVKDREGGIQESRWKSWCWGSCYRWWWFSPKLCVQLLRPHGL